MSLDHLVSVLLSLSSCASNLGFTFIALNHTVLNHFSLRLSPALQTLHCLLLRTSVFLSLSCEDSYSSRSSQNLYLQKSLKSN